MFGLLKLFEMQPEKEKTALTHIKNGDTDKAAKELEELIEEM